MERFERIYVQGLVGQTEIWVDRQTGVQYLWHRNAYAGGLTPLLDAEGKPLLAQDRTLHE